MRRDEREKQASKRPQVAAATSNGAERPPEKKNAQNLETKNIAIRGRDNERAGAFQVFRRVTAAVAARMRVSEQANGGRGDSEMAAAVAAAANAF